MAVAKIVWMSMHIGLSQSAPEVLRDQSGTFEGSRKITFKSPKLKIQNILYFKWNCHLTHIFFIFFICMIIIISLRS